MGRRVGNAIRSGGALKEPVEPVIGFQSPPTDTCHPSPSRPRHSTSVLPRRSSVFSRVFPPSACGGCDLAPPPPPGGHRHPQLDQSVKSHLNPAQVTGLAGPNSLGFGGGVHREEHHVGSGIGRDSARSRKWVAPAEMVGATEATILLNQRVPHELQPCQRSGLSPCVLPAKLPDRQAR